MQMDHEVLGILDEVLGLQGRAAGMTRQAPLLGAVPELDSMAVVAILTTIEHRFGFTIDDDELEASVFESVGSLSDFVAGKVAA